MFETTPSAEIDTRGLYEQIGAPRKLWSYVAHGLVVPWFHVEVRFERTQRFVFTPHLEQWLPLVDFPEQGRAISVRLVSPGWMNGTSDWKMDRLLEVWQGEEPEAEQDAFVFVVVGGLRYSQSDLGTPAEKIRDLVELYRSAS